MATYVNKYAKLNPLDPSFSVGKKVRTVEAVIETGATSTNGDVVVLAHGLPATARIVGIFLPAGSGAVTGLTDVDFGVYAANNQKTVDANGNLVYANTVIDADALADGVTFASAKASAIDLLGSSISGFDYTKSIAQLCNLSSQDFPAHGIDICATLNAVGTAAGLIRVNILVAED